MDIANFALFFAAALAIAISPGPGLLYVAARTLAGGRNEGLASSFGTGLGGLVHVAAGAVGVSALVLASAEAFASLTGEMIDVISDLLEQIGSELDMLSRQIFPSLKSRRGRPKLKSNAMLRNILIEVGNAGERLVPIEGSPPDLAALPPGCAFAPRCRFANEACLATRPQLRAVDGNGHFNACIRDDV